MLALERRRLENRSRWEGPGNARDGAANGAETSSCILRVQGQRGQAVLRA
jgi:hypothetical protein